MCCLSGRPNNVLRALSVYCTRQLMAFAVLDRWNAMEAVAMEHHVMPPPTPLTIAATELVVEILGDALDDAKSDEIPAADDEDDCGRDQKEKKEEGDDNDDDGDGDDVGREPKSEDGLLNVEAQVSQFIAFFSCIGRSMNGKFFMLLMFTSPFGRGYELELPDKNRCY